MNAKISVFIIFAEAIIYLLLYNLYDCTFKHLQPPLSSYIESHSIDFLFKSSKLFLYEGNIGFEQDMLLFPWVKNM